MDTSIINLDAVVTAEPDFPQVSRKFSYVNETGMQLSIHLPCGAHINLPPRQVAHQRMVLSVYVTYTVPMTVQINGIVGSNVLTEKVSRNLNNEGKVTLLYELKELGDLYDGKMIIIDEIKVGVYKGFSDECLYPKEEQEYCSPVLLTTANHKEKFYSNGTEVLLLKTRRSVERSSLINSCNGKSRMVNETVIKNLKLPFAVTEKNEDNDRIAEELKTKGMEVAAPTNTMSFAELAEIEAKTISEKITKRYNAMGISQNVEFVDVRKFEREEAIGARRESSDLIKWGPSMGAAILAVATKSL